VARGSSSSGLKPLRRRAPDLLLKRSSLRSLRDIIIIFVTCRNIMNVSTCRVCTPLFPPARFVHHVCTPPYPWCLCPCWVCLTKDMMLMCEHFPRLGYDGPTHWILLSLCTPTICIVQMMLVHCCPCIYPHSYILTMSHPPRFPQVRRSYSPFQKSWDSKWSSDY